MSLRKTDLTWDEAVALMRNGYTINSARGSWGLSGSYLSMKLGKVYINIFKQDPVPYQPSAYDRMTSTWQVFEEPTRNDS